MKPRLIDSILRADLYSFTEKVFRTLEPSVDFLHNWHIQEIADALQKVEMGKTKRLIINMPPRYLKSICISVGWSAWLMGRNPALKIISASHNSNLSVKHNLDVRKILQSQWFADIFPDFKFTDDQNEKHKFMSSQFGFRMATSVNSNITGEGADFIIVDDPLTPEQAFCKEARDLVTRWFDQTLSTRLNNKKKGAIVVVGQRLHEDDLCGSLLKRGNWQHLCLPAINDNNELLHEEREGWDEINQIKSDLGEFGFAAQYLQKPIKMDAGIIKQSWLKYYEELPTGKIYQSWDTAIKTAAENDYSVCITFVETENGYYVADILRDKLEYPNLRRRVLAMAEKWQPTAILMEDKASGQSILQDLKQTSKLPLIAIMPKHNKLQRVAAISPIIEAGKLFLPKTNTKLFFRTKNMVDSISQFLNWVHNKSTSSLGLKRL